MRSSASRLTPLAGLLAALLGSAGAQARPVEHFTADANGVRLEITALRDDVIRVRAGRGALPEDASWAVLPFARQSHRAMDEKIRGRMIHLLTGKLDLELDPGTLHLTVRDRQGRLVVEDAPTGALSLTATGPEIRKGLEPDAHIFGLGDKSGPMDRRGGAFTLWNTDAFGFGVKSDPLYKAIPFYLAVNDRGESYGLLFDNTFRSRFDFGKSKASELAISADGGPVDYYILSGPSPREVVSAYAFLTGPSPLPPMWSLGFQQSRWSYKSDAETRAIADRLRADHIPSDVIYLDIDYQDRNRPFTVNTSTFPDMGKLVSDLAAQRFHLVLITDLHIPRAPAEGYAPYDSGKAGDHFVKTPAGTDYTGEVWPGPTVFPDFSRAATRQWWGGLYGEFAKMGVDGFWNDMNEPSIFHTPSKTMPLDTVHRIDQPGFAIRTATHAEMHNVFGMLNSRATYEGLSRLTPDRRPFVLTRASYAGGHRYAATWTGDNSSSWEHLDLATRMLVNLGLSGFAYAGDDIGGFAGLKPSPDLLTRWIEIGAFNPIFRDHAEAHKPPQEVWVHGPDHQAIRRRYIEARYRLMPYLYGLADENSRDGLPIMRPVFLEFPATAAGSGKREGADPFMLGPDLLIAPAPAVAEPGVFTVSLPTSGWFDYWTGQRLSGTVATETWRLDRLPVFVRPGAVIPRQALVQSTSERPGGPLELSIYPGADGHAVLYADDGVSLAYKRRGYLRQTLCLSDNAERLTLRFEPRDGAYPATWPGLSVVIHGWTLPAGEATLNGQPVGAAYDAEAGALTIALPDQPRAATLMIRRSRAARRE